MVCFRNSNLNWPLLNYITYIPALDNDILEHERKFDSNTVDLIFNFIKQLQGPVCLVAHNGTKCDFPILKKQILDCCKEIPNDVLVIDSLHVFRELNKLEEEEEETDKLSSNIKTEEIILENEESEILDTKNTMQKLNETTPKSYKPISKNYLRSEACSDEQTPMQLTGTRKRPFARKELFPVQSSTPNKSFSLINIHQRMFGEVPPISHYAEADTISLIKCATEKKVKFVELCEANATLFCDVKPLSPIW